MTANHPGLSRYTYLEFKDETTVVCMSLELRLLAPFVSGVVLSHFLVLGHRTLRLSVRVPRATPPPRRPSLYPLPGEGNEKRARTVGRFSVLRKTIVTTGYVYRK